MNYLIADIGNTNIKVCKKNKNFKIIKTYLFQTRNPNLERDLRKKLKQLKRKIQIKKFFFLALFQKFIKRL
ncbi:MAG: hypothetical protein CM1200mP13_17760 [Candidatus Pelagibacterales bacterium]|nr:MAG: hypothetical protein CM1200mP13_17760 [Pelagibacterales bacterium]